MRFLLASVLVVCFACAKPSSSSSTFVSGMLSTGELQVGDQLKATRIARGMFVFNDERFTSANIVVAKMPDGTVVLASSPMETQGTRLLLAAIERELRPSRMIAVNTHFHMDGTGGNEAYREAGVEIYGSTHTTALLRDRGEAHRLLVAEARSDETESARIRTTRVVLADHEFGEEEGLELVLGEETVRVIYPGPAHSPDNVVVWFPFRGVLFGGCMVKSMTANDLGYTDDADVANWPSALQQLIALEPTIVVPGHGPPGGPELLTHTQQLLQQHSAGASAQ